MQDYVEPSLGSVAFNNKLPIEGWQLENRHRGQGTLKCPKMASALPHQRKPSLRSNRVKGAAME
jgi:hypothetical protein